MRHFNHVQRNKSHQTVNRRHKQYCY